MKMEIFFLKNKTRGLKSLTSVEGFFFPDNFANKEPSSFLGGGILQNHVKTSANYGQTFINQ